MTMGEQMMGRATNMASAMTPIAAGGSALLGLDPISLGARGMFSGSALGAGMGMAAGGILGGGLMAGQYAGKQALMGMQEQQMLNSTLRSNFNFQGMSGRGMGLGEMGDIGQMMRSMSMQQGPGGEFTSMNQLTGLAAKMGQMGGARGIGDAREFTQKFREMMDTVKEVATAFSTNLEQAQQVMQSMKSSGIFRRQGQVAQQVRDWAQAGGIATEEVSQAMQFGSQMSRAIGGRGVAGAMGGMKTMGQIGIMSQTGMLSEEKIYDLTGQTGAAGRQALAQQQMQSAARFLKGGLGRRFIASMAGEDGSLDDESAQEYMEGGVGTGRTMGMAGRNLGKVGRANFIRNEGRLRGAALAKFGGMAPIAVMSQWLEQRGMDPMSDRGQIFMSRRLGMSVDEVDQQMRQFRMRDQIQQKLSDVGEDQAEWKRIEQQRGNTGIRGIKKSIDKFKNDLNSSMRQWGADLYEEGSNVIERWLNKATGNFVQMIDKDVGQIMRDTMRGTDAYAKSIAESHLGRGRGLVGQADLNRWSKEAFRGGGGVTMSALEGADAAGDLKRLRTAGFKGIAGARTDKEYRDLLGEAEGLSNAYQTGQGGVRGLMGAGPQQYDANRRGLDVNLARTLHTSAAFGAMSEAGGDTSMATFQRLLKGQGGQGAALVGAMEGKSERDKAAVFGDVMRAAGVGEAGGLEIPELMGMSGEGFATRKDMASALGDYMFKSSGKASESASAARRRLLEEAKYGGGQAYIENLKSMSDEEIVEFNRKKEGDKARYRRSHGLIGKYLMSDDKAGEDAYGGVDEKVREGVARDLLFSKEGRQMAFTAFGRDAEKREDLSQRMKDEAIELKNKAGGKEALKKNLALYKDYRVKQAIAMAADYTTLMEDTDGSPTEEALKKLAESYEKDVTGFMQEVKGVGAGAAKRQQALSKEIRKRTVRRGKEALKGYARSGMFDEASGGIDLSEEAKGELGKLEVRAGEKDTVMAVRGTAGLRGASEKERKEWMSTSAIAARRKKRSRMMAEGDEEGLRRMQEKDIQMMSTGETGEQVEMGLGEAYAQAMRKSAEAAASGDPESAAAFKQEAEDITGKLTVKGQRQLANFMETAGPGGKAAARDIRFGAGIEARLKGRGARGAHRGTATIAEMMGVELSAAEKREFAKMDPAEVSKRLLAKSGIDEEAGGKALGDPLQAALEAQRAGKTGEAAKKLKDVLGSGAAAEAGEKREKARLREEDPSYAAMDDMKTILGEIRDKLPEKDKADKPTKVEVKEPLEVNDQSKKGEDG
jgi:hypothetical protein